MIRGLLRFGFGWMFWVDWGWIGWSRAVDCDVLCRALAATVIYQTTLVYGVGLMIVRTSN